MKYLVSILLLCAGLSYATAQEVYTSSGRPDHGKKKEKKVKGYDPSRLIVGGTGMLGFGTGYADVGLSPFIGYQITDHIAAGVGLGYQYFKTEQFLYDPSISDYKNYPTSANIITPNVWTRVNIYSHFFAEGIFEYNFLYYSDYNYSYDNNGNTTIATEKFHTSVPCLLVGPGYRSSLGGRSAVYIEVLYDVLQQKNSPYYGTIEPRIGFSIGL